MGDSGVGGKHMDSSPGVITLLFTDLVGSTKLLERLGDDAAEGLRRLHFALLREAVAKSSGQEVKSLGDGIMVAFVSPVDAVGCAVAMQAAVRDHNEHGGGHPLEIRIGLHAGDPHRDAGDFHGTAVVVASRSLSARATPSGRPTPWACGWRRWNVTSASSGRPRSEISAGRISTTWPRCSAAWLA